MAEIIRVQLSEAEQVEVGEVSSLGCFGTGMEGSAWLGCGETQSDRNQKSARSAGILFPMSISTDPKPCQLDVKQSAEIFKPLTLPKKRGWSCVLGHAYGGNRVSAGSVDVSARTLSTSTERASERPTERVPMERPGERSANRAFSGNGSVWSG